MAPKKQTPPPIDRPLSRAYLREFGGWSTAYPPGQSMPNTLRLMENVWVDRNGAVAVRPGMRYLSYTDAPDTDPAIFDKIGMGIGLTPVGSAETFYTSDGSKALLFAVREESNRVGFRALLFSDPLKPVHRLTDPEIGFTLQQDEATISFSQGTTYVSYVQINNRIIALSDNGEPARMFYVGAQKLAKRLSSIPFPLWDDTHKLTVVHPNADWILARAGTTQYNVVLNPALALGTLGWNTGTTGNIRAVTLSGNPVLEVCSLPTLTNMQRSPLHNVAGTGLVGWQPDPDFAECRIEVQNNAMRVVRDPGDGLFLARGSKILEDVKEGVPYRVEVQASGENGMLPVIAVFFYSMNGAQIGDPLLMTAKTGSFSSPFDIKPPPGTTSMRIGLGGEAKGWGAASFKELRVSRASEVAGFFHGGSGQHYLWTGAVNQSASVYHPPVDVEVFSDRAPIQPTKPLLARINASGAPVAARGSFLVRFYNNLQETDSIFLGAVGTLVNGWHECKYYFNPVDVSSVSASVGLKITSLARGEMVYIDKGMLGLGASANSTYFDGSSVDTATEDHDWQGLPHSTASTRYVRAAPLPALTPETPIATTLIAAGGAEKNTYKGAFFYTFSNEIGESAPSKLTEIRVSRPWANWLWQKPATDGAPSTPTQEAVSCCDQLVVTIPRDVYEGAVRAGAISWNLYAISWSDQQPVPPMATLVGERKMASDSAVGALDSRAQPYEEAGWMAISPLRVFTVNDVPLPTLTNRTNESEPPKHMSGLVAGDRVVLVGDPDAASTIRWSSSRPGEYTNFSASRGGGIKTLSSGNLNLPVAVELWQNPQSVDTLTILCSGDDGRSISYYMAPASQQSSSSGTIQIMGFEETTSTLGTTSPYGSLVANNALYRPTDRSMLKSTAANYNVNHKVVSDPIANLWWNLRTKNRIVSQVLDNRIYLLVDNAQGEVKQRGCTGNEIWVLDIAAETPTWSCLKVHAMSLFLVDVGSRTFVGVTAPGGLYYLDIDYRKDDWADITYKIMQRPIPWMFETNTQGANKAHDAWAHLQQVGVTVGNWHGRMKYGVRGHTLHGKQVDVSKIVSSGGLVPSSATPRWDMEDILLIRRDMKEWFFYASSLPDEEGTGQVTLVQYRYTPVSVNVGYEFGSVETFEYGKDVQMLGGTHTADGIPIPMIDRGRP